MLSQRFQKRIKEIPQTPGVYRFLHRKKIVYVGKAAKLRSRVRSYFSNGASLSPMKQRMIQEITDIDWISTASEIEALLLEAQLIKKLKPQYNVVMRDDKSYLYIRVSTEEAWPRVFTTRRLETSGTYFGPFTSAHAVKETLRVLRKFLPYRCNQKPYALRVTRYGLRKPRACFWYHLGQCPGTCIGALSQKEYQKSIRRIIRFLDGKQKDVLRDMKKEVGAARVQHIEHVLAHTRILSTMESYGDDLRALRRLLGHTQPLRRIEGYDISNLMGKEATGALVVFLDGEPAPHEYKRFKIRTVRGADDVAMLEEVFTRRFRHSHHGTQNMKHGTKKIWPDPDLMIIDGGKGQLNAAMSVLKKYKTNIPVISIAKGGHGGVLKQKEEMYFPGNRAPLRLSKSDPALHLLLRVRDEAHRFAIGYHRLLRKKKMFRHA